MCDGRVVTTAQHFRGSMVNLVIAGKAGVGKRTLVSRTPKESRDGIQCHMSSEDSVLRIDNKYFTAEVTVEIVEQPESLKAEKSDCEGLLLLFDAQDASTFEFLESWIPFIEEVDPAVLLCVANKSDTVPKADLEAATEKWQDWSLDHGLEMVVCSALNDEVESSRDAEGLARIFEAISSHTWTGLAMKGKHGAANGHDQSSDEEPAETAASAPEFPQPRHTGVDYKRFESIRDEEAENEMEQRNRAIPDLRDLPRPSNQLPPLELDAEVEAWILRNAPSAEEAEALADLQTQLRSPDVRISHFFLDASSLQSSPAGPNATAHVNHAEALPKIATVIQRTNQILKDVPSLLRLGVRYHVWSAMAGAGGALGELVPLALAWGQLESCAAETTPGFFKRVTLTRDALTAWVDEAVVPALLRCVQAGCAGSDYLRQLMASAGELKEEGNAFYKDKRPREALRAYSTALKILEQLWVPKEEARAARKAAELPKDGKFVVEREAVGGGAATGADGWPRFLLPEAKRLTVTCHLNSAQAALALPAQDAETAVQHATFALALDPSNAKGFYRRGVAFMASPSKEEGGGDGDGADSGGGGEEGGREERPPQFAGGGGSQPEKPPKETLLAWAVRDLEQARALAGAGDKLVEGALKQAREQSRALMRERLRKEGAGGLAGVEDKEEGGDDDKDFSGLVDTLRAARVDGQKLSDAQRRERAAAAAQQAAAFLGVDPGGDSSAGGDSSEDEA